MKKLLSVLLVIVMLCSIGAMGVSAASTSSNLSSLLQSMKFDPNTIKYCAYLNDTNRVAGAGHSAIMLIDAKGNGCYFSFYSKWGTPYGPGIMDRKTLAFIAVADFFKNGIMAQNDTYNRFIKFPVTATEGKAMYSYAQEVHEKNSFMYSVTGWQCDNVVQRVMKAGNKKYEYSITGTPNTSFNNVKKNLDRNGISYTVYTV